jgi:hypothetical protein
LNAGISLKSKDAKPSTDLEPQNPSLKPLFDSIDHIYPNPCDVGL